MKIFKLLFLILILLNLGNPVVAAGKGKIPPIATDGISDEWFKDDKAARVVTCFFWASGFNRDDSAYKDDELPLVQIGGPTYHSAFFDYVKTCLEKLPDNYVFGLMLDKATRITNKANLGPLEKAFGERFFVADVETVGKSLIHSFPRHEEGLQLLIDNAIGGAPVLTSDVF